MRLSLILALAVFTATAWANDNTDTSAELRFDSRNRPVIATQVNEQGPYYMVVDTGAESTLIAPELAKRLNLESFDSGLTINGATGTIAAQAFPVDRFSSKLFDVSYVGLLSMPYSGSTEAAGIIGMDLFAQNALVFDFPTRKLRVLPSGKVTGKYLNIPAVVDDSLLIHITIKMNGVDMTALIDTGAAASIGNLAALKAMGWQTTDSHLADDGAIRGATSDISQIKKTTIRTISLAGITMRDVPVRFTTADDGQSPSLILGVDVLNSLIGFAIDFPKQQLLIKLPD